MPDLRSAAVPDRDLDLVLLGATGFTGGLVAEHLARRVPAGTRWALGGRDRGRLEALRRRLGVDVEVVVADVEDRASVRRLAESARVVGTTVGPYVEHGDPVVAACAAAGTDYADLAGEPEFFDRTYVRHAATAERSGARLVSGCGFDSVPADLGVQHCVEQLPAGVPLTVRGAVSAGGTFSGGTYRSAVLAFARHREAAAAHRERRASEPTVPPDRRVRLGRARPAYDRTLGAWTFPLPVLDPHVVAASARRLPAYGPDFRYTHVAAVRRTRSAVALVGSAAALAALAPTRPGRALLDRLHIGRTGPSADERRHGWFRVRLFGEGGGRRVVTEVAGGDPGYGETAVMFGESVLSLAFDDLPPTAGQVTPAVAMGPALRRRLIEQGLRFDVVATEGVAA